MSLKDEKKRYEMGGPCGAAVLSVLYIAFTYFNTEKCVTGEWTLFRLPKINWDVRHWFDTSSSLCLLAWFVVQLLLYTVPVGKIGYGPTLKGGKTLQYRLNGLFVLSTNLLGLVVAFIVGLPINALIQNMLQLLTAGILACLLLSCVSYLCAAQVEDWKLNPKGNTGHAFYDWFIGRELNPRIGPIDVKYVIFRSGIIGWMLLNFANLILAFAESKISVSPNLVLLEVIQFFYVLDYFWLEEGILMSRDIVHEGLGFNIAMQFLMIPFSFCTQSRYVTTTGYSSSWIMLLIIFTIYATGYWIYRASNSEKNKFRHNPDDPALAYLKSMQTKSGKRLLISGWWGVCRHPNYLGDLLISLSYSLCTGMGHFMPYVGFVLLLMLLIDREKRDSQGCKEKYGTDWDKYCQIVKYRIIPAIY
ncbi:delta(14)-sterol reductase LBR-like [Ostrea edulis]|uniref:delta(14)-sterol reductase LBR-like n=1 Tax=Ostrea edulis TaxID=37623 RepID=UPI0024AF1404|nr:delta(14)-sterol reductase LBR-like [Ostrea edulis]